MTKQPMTFEEYAKMRSDLTGDSLGASHKRLAKAMKESGPIYADAYLRDAESHLILWARHVLWKGAAMGGVERLARSASHWLRDSSASTSTMSNLTRDVKRQVAVEVMSEALPYVPDEDLRHFVGGIQARAFGDLD